MYIHLQALARAHLDYKSNHFSTNSGPDLKKRKVTIFLSEFCLIFVKLKIKPYGYR